MRTTTTGLERGLYALANALSHRLASGSTATPVGYAGSLVTTPGLHTPRATMRVIRFLRKGRKRKRLNDQPVRNDDEVMSLFVSKAKEDDSFKTFKVTTGQQLAVNGGTLELRYLIHTVETDKDKINLSTPLFNIMKARDVLALSEGDPLVIELQYIKKNNKEDPDYSSSGEE
jgi:hypothetical protein